MSEQFSAEELRVLGVLIEKALTTPDAYPLTLNAIVAGCNQKQNRNPVLELDEGTVSRTTRTLRNKRIMEQAPPMPGARANRFQHLATEHFHWDRRELAIMAELMLRGPQTPGELRSRAGRMTPFQDVQSVVAIVDGLAGGETPFVKKLPREPGRSANRYCHLLGGDEGPDGSTWDRLASRSDDRLENLSSGGAVVPATTRTTSTASGRSTASEGSGTPGRVGGLDALISRVEKLEETVGRLSRRLENLEERGGDDREAL